jgi:thioredoxin-related protein
MVRLILVLMMVIFLAEKLTAQEVNWLSFSQLDSAMAAEARPVFIDFYTEWCTYCRKMDKRVFTRPEVSQILNETYYAVKMDAETREVFLFDGKEWKNKQATDKRDGFHELAMLLASRNGEFVPPAMLMLSAEFEVKGRFFKYLDSRRLLKELNRSSVD